MRKKKTTARAQNGEVEQIGKDREEAREKRDKHRRARTGVDPAMREREDKAHSCVLFVYVESESEPVFVLAASDGLKNMAQVRRNTVLRTA